MRVEFVDRWVAARALDQDSAVRANGVLCFGPAAAETWLRKVEDLRSQLPGGPMPVEELVEPPPSGKAIDHSRRHKRGCSPDAANPAVAALTLAMALRSPSSTIPSRSSRSRATDLPRRVMEMSSPRSANATRVESWVLASTIGNDFIVSALVTGSMIPLTDR